MSAVRISDVASITMGQAPPGKDCNKEGRGTAFVKAGEFGDRFPQIVEWTTKPQKLAKAGDTLVCVVGATAGKVNQAIDCAIGRSAASVRARQDKIDPDYLYRFFETKILQLRRISQGLAQGVITREMLGALEVPLPPLPEQRRIAAILDQADALRRLRRRAFDQVNALDQALFQETFGDPTQNPFGWPTRKLGDICDVGSSKRVFVSEFTDSGVPFYRGTEIGKLGAGEAIYPTLFIENRHYKNLIQESGRPAVGDLLLPSICHDGRIWKVDHDEPFYFKDGRVLWIKSGKADINAEYLRRHLKSTFLRDYSKIASGTTFAELKIVNLKKLPILCPPPELQKRFASQAASLDKNREDMIASTSVFETLFASLQHHTFGEEL